MRRIVFAVFMALIVNPVFAEEVTPRPRLENYANYNEFLAAVYAYKKQLELEKKFADSIVINIQLSEKSDTEQSKVSVMPIKSPEMSPLVDTYLPPLVISGPEDLEMAIEAAKRFLHPIYQERLRYQRTTVQSFPLKPLELSVLGEAAIGNGLKLSSSPDIEQQVASNLAGNTPDKKTKEALEQSDDMSEASLSILKKAGTFFGNDVFINGPVSDASVSVQYRP
jgi:hypothetical protein